MINVSHVTCVLSKLHTFQNEIRGKVDVIKSLESFRVLSRLNKEQFVSNEKRYIFTRVLIDIDFD